MTTNPIITEATIRSLATPESYSRGETYYHSGAATDIERRGDMLRAEVAGSSYEPYQVTVTLDASGIVAADCSCPYDWGGYCKHIVAVLLAYIHNQAEIAERPTFEALLAGLDAETLRGLLGDLLDSRAELIPWVETQIALRTPQGQPIAAADAHVPAKPRRSPIDVGAIRRQVRYQMRGSDDYYATSGAVSGLDSILAQAGQALDANDGENALAIALAIAEEIIPGWEEFDDSDGEFGDFFSRLGAVVTEALLTADPSPAARETWAKRLEKWQAELDDYGVEDAFDAALCAAQNGWDYAPLRHAMEGQAMADEAFDDESWFADELTETWLNVLERQGRTDEFLNLSRAKGCVTRYVTMLAKAGRMQAAIDYGLSQPLVPDEALALAQTLREYGQHEAALRIAERSLDLNEQQTHELAVWLREAATAQGDALLALKAARSAFDASPTLADYLAVQAAAGADWKALRTELLRELNERTFTWISGPIEIYLHEGLVDAAVQLVDRQPYVDHVTLGRVADAAYKSHPDWVIRHCQRQAEAIMDPGKSRYYANAIAWLEKARKAYQATGRADEWRSYCAGLIAKHGRKYSLVPSLKALLDK